MKKFLLMVFLLSTMSCSGQDGSLPDKKTMSVIKKAEKVVYYALDPWSEDTTKYLIDNVPTTGFTKELNMSEKDSLIVLISENLKNVRKRDKGKFCPSAPQDAFLFVKGKDTIKIIFDLNCASYCIINDTIIYEYDFDKIYDKVSKMIKPMRKNELLLSNSVLKPDSTKNLLTDKMLRIISRADSAVCFLLDPLDKQSKDTLNGFCILEQSDMENNLIDSLKKTLLDKQNFVYYGVFKNCTFLCDICFRLFSKGEYVDAMFALYCDDCVVLCGDEHVKSDSGNMRKKILEIAKCVYPKDRYIRYMLNQ